MAVYKIPQDVEADDKFVGPLSFKQFIYCGIAAIGGYLSFLSLTKGFWPALIFFAPIIIAAGFLGFPWGRDQPTEIWLAARIRFFLKPRVRIWNQSGIKDLVTVTAPKHVETHFTNGLSQNEVTSRLSGLADLLDSRGWAVKNVNVNLYSNPIASGTSRDSDDRLLSVTSLPQEVVDVTERDDILDENTSPTAQHFDQMIKTSEQKHRQEVMSQLQAVRTPDTGALNQPAQQAGQGSADYWFLQQGAHNGDHQTPNQILDEIRPGQSALSEPGFTTFRSPNIVAPHTAATVPLTAEAATAGQKVSAQEEQALLEKIHKDHDQSQGTNPFGRIRTIMPLGQTPPQNTPVINLPGPMQPAMPTPPTAPVTPPVDPAIINLANNDDLNVATLARQADKANEKRPSDDEVVISLR